MSVRFAKRYHPQYVRAPQLVQGHVKVAAEAASLSLTLGAIDHDSWTRVADGSGQDAEC